jgi:hypothetical protein
MNTHEPPWAKTVDYGTIIAWSEGPFKPQTQALRTEDGWVEVQVDRMYGKIFAKIGRPIQIPDRDQSQFGLILEGVAQGDTIKHPAQMDGLPVGSVIANNTHGKATKVQGGKWTLLDESEPHNSQFFIGFLDYPSKVTKIPR